VDLFLNFIQMFLISYYVTPTNTTSQDQPQLLTMGAVNGSQVKSEAINASDNFTVSTPAVGNPGTVTGVYKYDHSTNFENYLQELGVSSWMRKMAGLATPTVTVSRNSQCNQSPVKGGFRRLPVRSGSGNPGKCKQGVQPWLKSCPTGDNCKEWTIHTSTGIPFINHEVSFNLNETVTDTTLDGRNIESTVLSDDVTAGPPVWRETQVGLDSNFNRQEGGKTTQLIRTFLSDKMLVEMSCGSVKASSVFNRVTDNKQ